ncbi:SIS domain-containing protein [Diplocarpon rosae]|nr:SIS domain-containing protein [Diplocarpon rosae]
MTGDHPVQNSEVYLMPPSPPSPATPCERALSPPPDDDLMSMTPPELNSPCLPSFATPTTRMSRAVHVLGTEATALSCLTRLYATEPIARGGFNAAVEAITRFRGDRGKLIISGVGKSGHIAKKLVATMNSLKIHATYLHPTEALHGDLGKVGPHDTILLITFSGKTPELLALLPHLDAALPLLIMTSHTQPSTCEIIRHRPDAILLPAPIHKSETECFGVNAPTTSTTMALALGDALAVVVSTELHVNVQAVFSQNHPGGAIGQAVSPTPSVPAPPTPQSECESPTPTLADLALPLAHVPELGHAAATGAHVLLAAYRSPSGWVRHGADVVVPPRRVSRLVPNDMDEPAPYLRGLMVPRREWILVPAEMGLSQARAWVVGKGDEDVLATVVEGTVVGVLEVGSLRS